MAIRLHLPGGPISVDVGYHRNFIMHTVRLLIMAGWNALDPMAGVRPRVSHAPLTSPFYGTPFPSPFHANPCPIRQATFAATKPAGRVLFLA